MSAGSMRAARAELVAAIQGIAVLMGELDGDAVEAGFERYNYAVDVFDDVLDGVNAARAAFHEATGVPDYTDEELARLRREISDAKIALGEAWLRGGASLAEGVRRKTAFLEGMIHGGDAAAEALQPVDAQTSEMDALRARAEQAARELAEVRDTLAFVERELLAIRGAMAREIDRGDAARAEVERLREAMPSDEDAAALAHWMRRTAAEEGGEGMHAPAWFDRWLARLDAARSGDSKENGNG